MIQTKKLLRPDLRLTYTAIVIAPILEVIPERNPSLENAMPRFVVKTIRIPQVAAVV
jgi:hypothetical protein